MGVMEKNASNGYQASQEVNIPMTSARNSRRPAMKPSRSILDESFQYVPSVATSVADTWRRFGWRPKGELSCNEIAKWPRRPAVRYDVDFFARLSDEAQRRALLRYLMALNS
jgi:hypothetical protein